MNVEALIKRARQILNDTTGTDSEKNWSDAELVDEYANDGVREFARRAKVLYDSSTAVETKVSGTADGTATAKLIDSGATFQDSGVVAGMMAYNSTDETVARVLSVDSNTQLTLSADIFASGEGYSVGYALCMAGLEADDKVITLSPKILDIRGEPFLSVASRHLKRKEIHQLNVVMPLWRTIAASTPLYYSLDTGVNKFRLVPGTNRDETLYMDINRLPLDSELLQSIVTDAEPPIREQYHQGVLYRMVARALAKEDTDAKNPAKAMEYSGYFQMEIEKAKREEMMRRKTGESRLRKAFR